ncbi:hypothetical protein [Salmonirosea aquatica]|uniref:Lipoprotein n=1 Tax=Salmonirosea aquatica TaxID=2654236 RepID=A0A7C9FS51_9BACT|nr:hypothetical protein [Cytophagaceae bacterium SJW1-29]
MLHLKLAPLGIVLMLLGSACQGPAENKNTGTPEVSVPSADSVSTAPARDTGDSYSQKSPNPDWLLKAGKGAGQTQLQATSESVVERLGPPDDGDAAMMHAVMVWYADSTLKTGHSLAIFTARDPGNDPAARITEIRVNSPRFETSEGIRVGTPLADIVKRFQIQKVKEYNEKGRSYTLYDDKAAGIAFEIDAEDRCQAVIIHIAGKPFVGSYLTFP